MHSNIVWWFCGILLGLSIDIILDLWSITALHVHVDEYSIVAIKIGTHYTARSMVNHKLSGSKTAFKCSQLHALCN